MVLQTELTGHAPAHREARCAQRAARERRRAVGGGTETPVPRKGEWAGGGKKAGDKEIDSP